jgi:hypothetical protein
VRLSLIVTKSADWLRKVPMLPTRFTSNSAVVLALSFAGVLLNTKCCPPNALSPALSTSMKLKPVGVSNS